MTRVEFGILGPLEVRVGDDALPLGGPKQRALLAILVLSANRVVSRERLIEELWPDLAATAADHALRVQVSRLRKALAVDGSDSARLVTSPPGYVLRVEPGELDLQRFERLVAEGRQALQAGDPERAVTALRGAEGLWRGRPLADLEFEDFARVDVERLQELRLAAVEDRIDADLALGRHGGVIAELEALAAEHPLRERVRAQLMLALYRSGRQAEALEAFRSTRSMLVEELGLDPGPALKQLEQAILCQHEQLELPHPVGRVVVAAAPEAPIARDAPPSLADPEGQPSRVRGRRWAFAAVAAVAAAAFAAIALLAGGHETIAAGHGDALLTLVDGNVTEAVPLRAAPTRVTAGFGSLWVTHFADGTVERIDAGKTVERETIRVGSGPSAIAAGAGAVWVANSLDGTVARIDPGTDEVVQTIKVGPRLTDVVVARGAVWVAPASGHDVARLDGLSGGRLRRVDVGAAPTALAAGAGAVWVTTEAGRLSRIDARTNAVTASVGVGGGPGGVAVGAGSVWVANSLDGTVSRVDPARGAVVSTVAVGARPAGVAVTAGSVWVADEFDGTLSRIDPATDRVAATVAGGDEPTALSSQAGRLVVGVRAQGPTHRGGRLVLLNPNRAFDSIDPASAYELFPTALLGMTNDGLLTFKHVGGADGSQIVPDLAVSLPARSADGRTYLFTLRPGIRYSTGRPVRAGDFRYALERVFRQRSQGAGFYAALIGAGRCMRQPRRCDLARGVIADDRAGTVTIRLRAPDPELPYKLALPFADAVPASAPPRDTATRPLPATGPYRIEAYRPGRELRLVRNPMFRQWSRAAQPDGYPDEIVWRLGVRADAAVSAIERGRADWMLGFGALPTDRRQEVATRYAGQLRVHTKLATDYVTLNVHRPPFDDVRARRALNYAIDRRAAVRLYGGPHEARPTCQILPPQMPGYRRHCPYTAHATANGAWRAPDLTTARRLVAAAGTKGTRVVVLDSNTPKHFLEEGRLVVDALRRIGYPATLKLLPEDVFLRIGGNTRKVSSNVQSGGWSADYPAASNFITLKLSCAAYHPGSDDNPNSGGFCSPRLDHMMQRAQHLQSTHPASALALWARIDRALVDRGAWVPLVTPTDTDLVSRRVGNYRYHPLWGPLIDQFWVR